MNCGASALLRQSASNGCGNCNHNGCNNNSNGNNNSTGNDNGMLLAIQMRCKRDEVKTTKTVTTTVFFLQIVVGAAIQSNAVAVSVNMCSATTVTCVKTETCNMQQNRLGKYVRVNGEAFIYLLIYLTQAPQCSSRMLC